MKIAHERNYTVFARDQILEVEPETAPFYEGIYFLELNQLIDIYFVPPFEGIQRGNVRLPADLDAVTSANDARLFLTGYNDYIVTPAPPEEPQPTWMRQIQPGDRQSVRVTFDASGDVHRCVLFYVSEADFLTFVEDLQRIAEKTPSVHDYVRYTGVQTLPVMQCVEQFVLNSILVRSDHFKILRRPYASFARLCVDLLHEHNAGNQEKLYHGELMRSDCVENRIPGDDEYEYAMVTRCSHPDRRFLPAAGGRRVFWSICKSAPARTKGDQIIPDLYYHFIHGVSMWPDDGDPNLLHLECFKMWHMLEEWADFGPSPNLVPETDFARASKCLTARLDEVTRRDLAWRIIRFVAGETDDFAG
ncbi:MAG: hypothetical protein JXA21_02805 [Anaerolineae bacterium]|nr:hypothetical protein [Anaerolineae bacterium]